MKQQALAQRQVFVAAGSALTLIERHFAHFNDRHAYGK